MAENLYLTIITMNGVAQATTIFPLNDYKSYLANPCACPGTFHNSCSVKSQRALLEYSWPHPPFHTLPLVTRFPVVCGVLWNSQGSLSCFSSTCDFIPYHAPHQAMRATQAKRAFLLFLKYLHLYTWSFCYLRLFSHTFHG